MATNQSNGRRVTWATLAILAAVAISVAGTTLWAADRFGAAESRISVLETHYGHISDTLERIETKMDRANQ